MRKFQPGGWTGSARVASWRWRDTFTSEGPDPERSARDCRTPTTRCDKDLPGCVLQGKRRPDRCRNRGAEQISDLCKPGVMDGTGEVVLGFSQHYVNIATRLGDFKNICEPEKGRFNVWNQTCTDGDRLVSLPFPACLRDCST